MDDGELFEKLASVYELGRLKSAVQAPRRAYGFPGIITLTPAHGDAIVVKELNTHHAPVDALPQRAVTFHQRCVAVGMPAPEPVLTSEGTHGSVLDVVNDPRYMFRIFTAEKFVKGKGLLETSLDRRETVGVLSEVGRAAALLRVASQRFGSWDYSPLAERPALTRLVQAAHAKEASWASALERIVEPLALAASVVSLDALSPDGLRHNMVASMDFSPKDAMLTKQRRLAFTDWERVELVDWAEPLGSHAEPWTTWADSQGVKADETAAVIGASFDRTLAQHPILPDLPIQSLDPTFLSSLRGLLDNASLALNPKILPQWRSDCEKRTVTALDELNATVWPLANQIREIDQQQSRQMSRGHGSAGLV